MTKVLEHVFLSGSRAINEEKVRKMGISCIINCAVEVRHVVRVSHVELVKIDIDDTPNTPIHSFFDQSVALFSILCSSHFFKRQHNIKKLASFKDNC